MMEPWGDTWWEVVREELRSRGVDAVGNDGDNSKWELRVYRGHGHKTFYAGVPDGATKTLISTCKDDHQTVDSDDPALVANLIHFAYLRFLSR